jgi:hypothetical protein
MTDYELLCLSLGVNIAMLYYHRRLVRRYDELSHIFGKLLGIMKGLADSELDIKRDREGNIRIKEKSNETDRPSVQADQGN